MNTKEIGEICRHLCRNRSNITKLYGCYINDNKEIISKFVLSTGMMSENEGEKYFALLKRLLSGSVGKNLIDINFATSQVAGSEEHSLLMELRKCGCADEELREKFLRKVMDTVSLGSPYLVLLACDSYDVPFKNKDGMGEVQSEETYKFILCAICPVKQKKATLHYVPEEKLFHDGAITNVVSAPELGFIFPAFDNRSSNIYNALYYTHSAKESHEAFVDSIFRVGIPKPAHQQKKSFEAILSNSLNEECNLEVVQTVHEQLSQRIELHKESKVPETLMISKEDVKDVLASCGISDSHMAKFSLEYDEAFGFEADLHPRNIINEKRFEVTTPDVSIKVAPGCADLIETRVIGGVKYILINAEENVEVNGVSIHINDNKA